MTATYDGVLTVSVKTKAVSACCRAMDEAAMRGQFYVSHKGQLMLRRSDKANAGQICVCCPFCGANVNGSGPSQGIASPVVGDSEEGSQ